MSRDARRAAQTLAGVGFIAASVFNATKTARNTDEVFRRMENDAWLPPWRWLIASIVRPRPLVVVWSVSLFEATAGTCMLGRGHVARAGLLAGAGWAVVTTPVLPPLQAAGNLSLAPMLAYLAAKTDRPR